MYYNFCELSNLSVLKSNYIKIVLFVRVYRRRKFSRMHECIETATVFIREKRLQMEMAVTGYNNIAALFSLSWKFEVIPISK